MASLWKIAYVHIFQGYPLSKWFITYLVVAFVAVVIVTADNIITIIIAIAIVKTAIFDLRTLWNQNGFRQII